MGLGLVFGSAVDVDVAAAVDVDVVVVVVAPKAGGLTLKTEAAGLSAPFANSSCIARRSSSVSGTCLLWRVTLSCSMSLFWSVSIVVAWGAEARG